MVALLEPAGAPVASLDPVDPVARPVPVRTAIRVARGLGRSLAVVVPVALLSTFVTYALGSFTNANPAAAVLGDTATAEDIARINHQFGLDQPLLVQYWNWITAALHGDLGTSWFTTIPVADSIRQTFPVDLSLTLVALVIAVLVGGSAGIVAALRPGHWFDRALTALCAVASTVPAFVIGIGLIVVFSVLLPVLPSGGYVPIREDPLQWLRFLILPALALSLDLTADIARQLRNSLVGTLWENFVIGAEVRGLSRRRVVFRHALRNAAGPTLTVLGFRVPQLIGGAVITETLFNLPGMGKLTLDAAGTQDVPVIQGTLLVAISLVLLANVLVNGVLIRLRPQARRGTT
jgi:peptide/nickel transport system permease protein